MVYFFRGYRFKKHRNMFDNQQGGVKMTLYWHDMENGHI